MAKWTATSTRETTRNNEYTASVFAAEAATEVVIARMDQDFLHQALTANVTPYLTILPSSYISDGWPGKFQFSDSHGNANQIDIQCASWQLWTNLSSEFTGLYGMANGFQITAYAKQVGASFPIAAGVQQTLQFSTIPVFQFAIYYSLDMEINPGAPMKVTGKTHGNVNMYVAPPSSLEFGDVVGAVGRIYTNRNSNDPTGGSSTPPIYDGAHLQGVSSLTLPIGTSNDPTNVIKILDAPPSGEDPHSQLGEQRYFNRADLIVTTSNNTVIVQYNRNEDGSSLTLVPTNALGSATNSGYTFIRTNMSFYDYRESKQVLGTEIDVNALTNWLASSGSAINTQAQTQLGHPINSVYVQDTRSVSSKLTAVRVSNGRYLPSGGLTLATPQPLYVRGHFNAPDVTAGLTNTTQVKPASLVSDAVTILSPNWSDAWNASTNLSARTAANATVNAALLSGIVPSVTVGGQGHYSGGVENFPRFLENWSGTTLTYNGSMVVMYPSRYATNFWIAPGTYYNPPTRSWAFDRNFLDPSKLPPCTPQVRKLVRSQWNVVAAPSSSK